MLGKRWMVNKVLIKVWQCSQKVESFQRLTGLSYVFVDRDLRRCHKKMIIKKRKKDERSFCAKKLKDRNKNVRARDVSEIFCICISSSEH